MVVEENLFSISEMYHENTKDRAQVAPIMAVVPQQRVVWYRAFKKYPHRPRVKLEVPAPRVQPGMEETVQRRRSIREFTCEPLTLDELNRLIYFGNGITGRLPSDGTMLPLRAAPSAGALYPIEVYPVVIAVEGLEPGIYHYDVEGHTLEFIKPGAFGENMFLATHRQEMVKSSAVVFVLTAMFSRTKVKYGERGYRYVLLDAGHLAQNIYLEATRLGAWVRDCRGIPGRRC